MVQSACQYDVTSRVSDFQNGEQSVHRRDGLKFRIYHGNTFRFLGFGDFKVPIVIENKTLVLFWNEMSSGVMNFRLVNATVNEELRSIDNWLMANKLSLNVKKSNFLIFRPYQKRIDYDVNVKISDYSANSLVSSERKEFVRYLGVLDSKLFWMDQITSIRFLPKSADHLAFEGEKRRPKMRLLFAGYKYMHTYIHTYFIATH